MKNLSMAGLGQAFSNTFGWFAAVILTGTVIFLLGFMVFIAFVLATPKIDGQTIKNADAIIVLTGGPHRIAAGLRLWVDKTAPRLFISGVFNGATKTELIAQNVSDPALRIQLNTMDLRSFEIGTAARTTKENATEIKQWAANKKINTIILITAENHLVRARILLTRALPNIKIMPYAVVRHAEGLRDYAFWRDSAIEYAKTILTLLTPVNL